MSDKPNPTGVPYPPNPLDASLPANAQVRVLVHELAHAQGIDYTAYTREQAEVIVDTATIIACGSAGLDVTADAIPYIAGWGEDGALDAVRGFAAEIDRVARRIEEAAVAKESHYCEMRPSYGPHERPGSSRYLGNGTWVQSFVFDAKEKT